MVLGKVHEIAALLLGRAISDKELRALLGDVRIDDYAEVRTRIITSPEFRERYPEVYHFLFSRVEEKVKRSYLTHEVIKLKEQIDELRIQRVDVDDRIIKLLKDFDVLLQDAKQLNSRIDELNSAAAAITRALGG